MSPKKYGNLNASVLTKAAMIMFFDVLTIAGSYFFGLWLRAEFSFAEIRHTHLEGFLTAIGPWCAISVLVFLAFKLYNSIWAFVSTSEMFRIIGAYAVLAVIGVFVFHFDGMIMPRSSMVIGFVFSFLCTVCIRFSYRMYRSAIRKISQAAHANGVKNVMLIGAGDAGRALAMEFLNSDHLRDHLACVIDDNPTKYHKHLCGAPIVSAGRQRK